MRHELKRATEELVLEEQVTEASGERRWEEVASVYSTKESSREEPSFLLYWPGWDKEAPVCTRHGGCG